MSVISEKTNVQKKQGNTFDPHANKVGKKRRKSKKVTKEISQEESERRKKLANIVHKKVTVSTNWKNFTGQKLHMDKDDHLTANPSIKQDNLYKGTFRKNRKKLLAESVKGKAPIQQSEDISSIEVNPEQNPGLGLPVDHSKSLLSSISKPGPRRAVEPKQKPDNISADKARPRQSHETTDSSKKLTKYIGIDCEMVGVDDDRGKDSMLARVSLVNKFGECIYDKFVQPKEDITDYRTYVSGVRPVDLENAESFEIVQQEVAEIIKGRIIVGHSLRNDLKVLYLSHPRKRIRDTSKYEKFRQLNKGRTPSLKKLASIVLGVTIQEGEHSPVIDARAAMQLYMMYQKEWEAELRTWKGKRSKPHHVRAKK